MPLKKPPAPVGRPREFDEGTALDGAMRLFWRVGYDAVTMPDLEKATGLARSSLYNAFGGKRDLYLKALGRFHDRLADALFSPLESGTRGLDDLHAFFDRLEGGIGGLLGEGPFRGCFIVNSMVEFAGRDADVADHGLQLFARLRHAVLTVLRRAAKAGECAKSGHVGRARLVVMIAIGINVKARAGESAADMAELFEAAHELVESWRVAPPAKPKRAVRRRP